MVGPARPIFVLFGSSIVQFSFSNGGWGAILADVYARKVILPSFSAPPPFCNSYSASCYDLIEVSLLLLSLLLLYLLFIYVRVIFLQADILLRGYSGWNSRRALEVLDKVFPKDATVQPSLVIVYFGGNDSMGSHSSDLGPHVPLPEYIDNMRRIANHLKSLSEKIRIIFLTCPPVDEEKLRKSTIFSDLGRTNEACKRYSEACIEMCKEMDLKVIDLWTATRQREDWRACFMDDGIHLSSEGSMIVVEEILKLLKEADWEPSLHWKSMPTEFGDGSPYDIVSIDGKSTVNISEWTFHRDIQWD
ncbi:GDSL esterase/lipase wdl1 [Asimina triloba]